MNIEKQIYSLLIASAGGKQKEIKGVSQPTLRDLKRGSGTTAFSKVFDILFENGITTATLESDYTIMTLNCKDKTAEVEPKINV